MLNWFDIMRQAQDGAGLDNMARHFGLSPEQTRTAVAALMPACAMGLQYLAANPSAMAQLFRMTASGPYPNFWESAAQAFTPRARQEGDRLLDQLFGSDEVSRRVAHQAATFSGIGADVMQQMLPLVAGIMAGGIAKVARGQGAMLNPFMSPPAETKKGPTPSDPVTAWIDLWRGFIGLPAEENARQSAEASAKTSETAPAFWFEDMMAGFLNPLSATEHGANSALAAKPQPKPQPTPQPTPEEPQGNPLGPWETMMEVGSER